MITANIANSYNREVFAVPGRLHSTYSTGTNDLIKKQQAQIYTSVTDLQYYLGWEEPELFEEVGEVHREKDLSLEGEESMIYETLKETEGMVIDEVARKSQIPINKLAGLLLNLEFKGIVKPLPGNVYKLN